ncbi:hypothetical protein [Undibacterium sp.]|jgi:hypothetical protein|uniref:hypothetical protein n=1 Tax=Undibacterium sp. TaxID=1914977 RepID=UPI002CBF34B3|nr:hypothetical protein [Undibacterium sp.]HTD02486.1 hypothetical protein [Undibacterium sp.]
MHKFVGLAARGGRALESGIPVGGQVLSFKDGVLGVKKTWVPFAAEQERRAEMRPGNQALIQPAV